jgi:hypothetical protein
VCVCVCVRVCLCEESSTKIKRSTQYIDIDNKQIITLGRFGAGQRPLEGN